MKSATASSRPTLKLIFDDKPYHFGETIEVRIDLSSKTSSPLRDLSLELTRLTVVIDKRKLSPLLSDPLPDRLKRMVENQIFGPLTQNDIIETEALFFSTNFVVSTLRGRAVFQTFRVSVAVPFEKSIADISVSETWWLVAKLNIAKGRDVTVRKQVQILS